MIVATACLAVGLLTAGGLELTERTEWVMGTALRVVLPADRVDSAELFAACFEAAREWDALLSPWQDDAPLTRLSAAAGAWVELPPAVLDYLERAARDAVRTGHVFDITLTWRGSQSVEIDRDRGRAKLPATARALDPGGDGKGVALDAMAAVLDAAGVREAMIDFGGSSFVARGRGPGGDGWQVALTGPGGSSLGVLRLRDTALSVSSTVQRDHRGGGAVVERFHLMDLRTGEPVAARRTAVVFDRSATAAEVLSTTAAIVGREGLLEPAGRGLMENFPGSAVGLFEAPDVTRWYHGDFAARFVPGPAPKRP